MSIRLYVCEDCETFSSEDNWQKHITHRRTVLDSTGDDWDALGRIAARHLVLAKRIRAGTVDDGTLQAELHDATMRADWFSEEDSIYDEGWREVGATEEDVAYFKHLRETY